MTFARASPSGPPRAFATVSGPVPFQPRSFAARASASANAVATRSRAGVNTSPESRLIRVRWPRRAKLGVDRHDVALGLATPEQHELERCRRQVARDQHNEVHGEPRWAERAADRARRR